MEKHCVSLEVAKQLKEVGWKKESFWVWLIPFYSSKYYEDKGKELPENLSYSERMGTVESETEKPFLMNRGNLQCYKNDEYITWEILDSPLATEILEELSDCEIVKKGNQYAVTIKTTKVGDTLCEALAKMWIYLQKGKNAKR